MAFGSATDQKNLNLPKQPTAQDNQQQQINDALSNIKMQQQQLVQEQGARPGIINQQQNEFEKKAGVTPPSYEGTRDSVTGQLLDQYKQNPYGGEALQNLKGQAFSQGLSPWAQVQMSQQKLEEQKAGGLAGKQAMQAQSGAQSQLARMGGVRSGASALLARQGQRDLLNAQQGVAGQGMQSRLGIQGQDIERKNQLLGKFGDLETSANQANIGQATGDINRKAAFDVNRYNEQMKAWAAQQSANAQQAAGGGGKK